MQRMHSMAKEVVPYHLSGMPVSDEPSRLHLVSMPTLLVAITPARVSVCSPVWRWRLRRRLQLSHVDKLRNHRLYRQWNSPNGATDDFSIGQLARRC
eukprot:6213311-Pleurochrysis_carterae.AAC.4